MLTKEKFDRDSFIRGMQISNSKVFGTLWNELDINVKTLDMVFDTGAEGEKIAAEIIHTAAVNYVGREYPFAEKFIQDELVKIIVKGHMSLLETYVEE